MPFGVIYLEKTKCTLKVHHIVFYALVIHRTILQDLSAWLFAGKCKSIADQWKLLYIFGSKVAIFVDDEFDTNQTTYKSYS